ncbi:MAG: TlpA family protein disulfide reductase [Sulfobacillus sp.]
MRIRLIVAAILLLVAIGATVVTINRLQTPVVGAAVGDQAPPFTLTKVGGGTLSLASLRGHPLLLNFMASWCGPCKAELPALQAAATMEKGVVDVVTIDLTFSEPGQAAPTALLAQDHIHFPVLLDQNGKTSYAYGVVDLPLTLAVNAQGVIVGELSSQASEQAFLTLMAKAQ